MKLFQELQNTYRMLGIHPQNRQRPTLNLRNGLIFGNLALGFTLTGAFCLFQAKSVRDIGDSFYASATELGTLVYFSVTAWKMANIMTLIEKFEKIVETSKSDTIEFSFKLGGLFIVSILYFAKNLENV